MDDEGYRAFFGMVVNAGRVLDIVPMQRMLDTVNHADSAGAMIDPTAYRTGWKNLGPQREVLEAAINFHKVVTKHAAADRDAPRD